MNLKFKPLISVLTAAVIAASLTACQGNGELSDDSIFSENESSDSTTISENNSASSSSSSTSGSSSANSLSGSPSSMPGNSSLGNVSSSSSNISAAPNVPSESGERILIAYFSRRGNTNYPNDVDATTSASIVIDNDRFGTTEYIARMIQETVGGDIHPIKTVTPYTTDFDELTDVNHSEMASGFLPKLKKSDLDISEYDTIFVGYPVWATDVPLAVISFLDQYDFSDKTVIPFCTHDGYGAGKSYNTIASASKAKNMIDGLAIEAKDVPSANRTVTSWLNSIGVSRNGGNNTSETAVKIKIGDKILDGVLYNTALAREIKERFPLTISMVGYGGV